MGVNHRPNTTVIDEEELLNAIKEYLKSIISNKKNFMKAVEKEFEKIDDNTYILSGNMTIYDVNKLLNAKIPEGDYDTISGFLQDQLGRIPEDEENPIIETMYIK